MLVDAVGEFTGSATREIEMAQGSVPITTFPLATRALEVQVLGDERAQLTVGRSESFEIAELKDDVTVSVFMAPRRGFCPTGPPHHGRKNPRLVRTGDDVLVVGGVNSEGEPVVDVELYDPTRGVFENLGEILHGVVGVSVTSLEDGRVVIAGGPENAYTLYEPATKSARDPLLLPGAPAHHIAVALDATRVLLAGGCDQLGSDGLCPSGSTSTVSLILDVETNRPSPGPALTLPRIGGVGLVEADGRVMLVGGVDEDGVPVSSAERIDPAMILPSEIIDSVAGDLAPLTSGGFIAGFSNTGTPTDEVAIVAPGAAEAVSLIPGIGFEQREGATMTLLEDGHVLVFGGEPSLSGEESLLYAPVDQRFTPLESAPDSLRRHHGAVRLPDGSVLVLGGADADDTVLSDAWVFRPDLTGPFTLNLDVTFDVELAEHLVPSDPERATLVATNGNVPAHVLLESSGGGGGVPSVWAVVAGPEVAEPKLAVNVATDGAGVAVMLGYTDERNYHYLFLRSGAAAEVLRMVDGSPNIVAGCAGSVIKAADIVVPDLSTTPTTSQVTVDIIAGEFVASVAGAQVLRCTPEQPIPSGLVGVAIVGEPSRKLRIDRLSVGR